MCYNGSMDRLNVLKGIEGILVEKAYEAGHISHRKGGDWQKQADGSWIPYTGGQSDQSMSQAQEPVPTKSTGHGNTVKQDFESAPDSVKDKMFTIAQQYQSEWAEDSDEDVRSMAEGDVEDLAQKLWDTADEETRNSWLGDSDTPSADKEELGDLIETPDIDYEKPIGKSSEWTENYLSDLGYKPTEKDRNGRPTEYENGDWDTVHVTYDRLGYVTKIESEDEESEEGSSVQKSAVRDMRFTPAIKNMGF